MTTQNGTVFVVDDDHAVRKSLELLLKSVGLPSESFRSANEFLAAHAPARRGCLVLDIRMPGMSGLELQRTLRERGIDLPTIIITGHGDVPVAVRSLKDGALEFLEKPFSKQMLLEHIREGLKLDADRQDRRSAQAAITAKLELLTERERQVMELVVAGKVNKEAAAALELSKKTVDVHRARVMQKLGVESLAELVAIALTAKLRPESNGTP